MFLPQAMHRKAVEQAQAMTTWKVFLNKMFLKGFTRQMLEDSQLNLKVKRRAAEARARQVPW